MAGIAGDCYSKQLVKVKKYLNDVFKYPDFKNDIQKKAILKILSRKNDVIITLPEGYGKSLSYQLPGAMFAGRQATLIIYTHHFKTLAHVEKLTKLGVVSKILDEYTLRIDDCKILEDLRNGTIRPCLIYVSLKVFCDERIQRFFSFLKEKNLLAFITVDDSDGKQAWESDEHFNIYEKLGKFRKSTPEIPWVVVVGKILTHSIECLQDILELKTKECGFARFDTPVFRPNIYYDCVVDDLLGTSIDNLKEFVDQQLTELDTTSQSPSKNVSGLIYCKNQNKCIEIASELCKRGIAAAPFHNGQENDEHMSIFHSFLDGKYQVLTVTNYTGSIVQKENLKFVVHWGLPTDIFSYYNQTLLAGKNGKFARCRIYTTKTSLNYYNEHREADLLKCAHEGSSSDRTKFVIFMNSNAMKHYCTYLKCRHSSIADYFGDPPPKCIDKCDVCVAINKGSYLKKKSSGNPDESKKNKNKMKVSNKK